MQRQWRRSQRRDGEPHPGIQRDPAATLLLQGRQAPMVAQGCSLRRLVETRGPLP